MRPASYLRTSGTRIAGVRSAEAVQRVVVADEIGVLPVPGLAWLTLVQKASAVWYPAFCSVTASGLTPAPGGSSLFCFDGRLREVKSRPVGDPGASPYGLRFPLGILFAECGEKIPPEPP